MHGTIAGSGRITKQDDIDHVVGSSAHPIANATLGTDTERNTVTLLMRDGSRMTVALSDPFAQSPDLASCLASADHRPETVTLVLDDDSVLILPSNEIIGLHLPKKPTSASSFPEACPESSSRVVDVEVHQLGKRRVMRISNFLPANEVENIYRTVLLKKDNFKTSLVQSNDPEYRKSVVLFEFPYYQAMFQAMLTEAMPEICGALDLPAFPLDGFECQLTATYDKGYFKPHTDNAAQLGHRRLTYVYYFHRLPKPFTGGDIRFFDHNPFAVDEKAERHILDMSPLHNSIVFFDSGCYHEVRETTCSRPNFENARFTVNGWLSQPKAP